MLQALLTGDEAEALARAGRLQDIFGKDNLFVEIQDHGIDKQRQTMPGLLDIARKLGAPLLATNDSHYVAREDAKAHDALLCVQTNSMMSDPTRFKFDGEEHYLKSADEMRRLFPETTTRAPVTTRSSSPSAATSRSSSASRSCPSSRCPRASPRTRAYLKHLTLEGAQARWGSSCPTRSRPASPSSSRSSRTWASRPTSSSSGTSSSTPGTRASGSGRAGAAPPGAASPTACASPTSTPSSTTCCSSGSSTRPASPCPTSTWTSTPASGTR